MHRVVDVHATAPATKPDLRTPQSDSRPIRGHHPDRAATGGPSLDHGKPQDSGVEPLAGFQVIHLERDLAYAPDWKGLVAHI